MNPFIAAQRQLQTSLCATHERLALEALRQLGLPLDAWSQVHEQLDIVVKP